MAYPASVDISASPAKPDFARFGAGFGQKFIVTVDTEEEFDWGKPIDRHRHSLETIPALGQFQTFCEAAGVVPVYLVDYPIAASPVTGEVLGEAIAAGRAEVGVQLHPWVSPPHDEEVNEFNSFSGNLPRELERAKFLGLRDTIEANLGAKPLIYRAGRYGVGPGSAANLIEGGVRIDTSVRSRFDYAATGGVNFRDHPVVPYWLDRQAGLLELPLTTVYWGMLRQLGPTLYPMMWRAPRLRGILSRIGMLERIPLTPEGTGIEEAIRGIDIALDDGLPVLVFSFHSPSLAPGYTPYVRSEEDLHLFYAWWRQVFSYLQRRNVTPTCVAGILAALDLA